jgi:hypothetical protein
MKFEIVIDVIFYFQLEDVQFHRLIVHLMNSTRTLSNSTIKFICIENSVQLRSSLKFSRKQLTRLSKSVFNDSSISLLFTFVRSKQFFKLEF